MSAARHHAEWLSLVEVSGPFVSMPVLMRAFPQGLIAHDPDLHRNLRMAHEEWEDKQEGHRPDRAVHREWIRFVLREVLGFGDEVIAEGQGIQQTLQTVIPEHDETLRPDTVIVNPPGRPDAGKARLLVQVYPASQDLEHPVQGRTWKASPDTRMMELLHATNVRLGLVTNGERWMLVDAPRNETTGYASWYATLWLEEPITLRAFRSLLGMERFFGVQDSDTLESLLAESAQNQQDVTDQLGYQVRRAVEVLIQSLDQADQDHGRELLGSIPETELYEAALTVMMRLVFLFCAEERGLMLLDDEMYADNYAVSTLQAQLRETADQHGEEILERRHDAWCRLLSTFRVVYGGLDHDRLKMPAYGGRLFNPDRFAFLEGRKRGTTWKDTPADPLPVDNRTVLHLLEALQYLQVKVPGGGQAESRRLSFRALDIEQIGHVYEGLLDHTAKRASEPVLGLAGTKDKEPELPLATLEELHHGGTEDTVKLLKFLKEETGRSESALKKGLAVELEAARVGRFQAACGNDAKLWERVKPFAGLVRDDDFGHPVVVRKGSVYVTAGTDRRSSGTHYTPTSLTEPIVRYTLEPLVFVGPAEGKPNNEWKLRSPRELLDLKICDMACGSGAFLVQACRYMAERLVEAWEQREADVQPGVQADMLRQGDTQTPYLVRITPYGDVSKGGLLEQLVPLDMNERMIFARRLVAQRCLYGVDKNPLAAEMAKLSLWLLTLQKDRPFTFLDHAIRSGDSLVGIANTHQLTGFSLDGNGPDMPMFTDAIQKRLDAVRLLRRQIAELADNSAEDVERKTLMLQNADQQTQRLAYAANFLLAACWESTSATDRDERLKQALLQVEYNFKDLPVEQLEAEGKQRLQKAGCPKPFHWPLEFPEVFMQRGGFDAIVGNPPFMHGSWISTNLGDRYASHLRNTYEAVVGKIDYVVYFLHRSSQLVRSRGAFGLILSAKTSEGDARKVGFELLVDRGFTIYAARNNIPWPGAASILVCTAHLFHGGWDGSTLNSHLEQESEHGTVEVLTENSETVFVGAWPGSMGFVLSDDEVNRFGILKHQPPVIRALFTGADLNSLPTMIPPRFIIDFSDCTEEQASTYTDFWKIVEERVKDEKMRIKRKTYRERWWQFCEPQLALFRLIRNTDFAIAVSRVSKFFVFRLVPTNAVYTDKVVVFVRHSMHDYAVLSSDLHYCWALSQATTHGSGSPDFKSYKPSECGRTFPFPSTVHNVAEKELDSVGMRLHSIREEMYGRLQLGPTPVYNRFHDSKETIDDIQKLRQLHVEMDNAVAAAYGWTDLDLGHGFHETKQGLRFTISEPARREVLARLLKLNHERYAEEVAQGLHEKKRSGGGRVASGEKKRKKKAGEGPGLFGKEDGNDGA